MKRHLIAIAIACTAALPVLAQSAPPSTTVQPIPGTGVGAGAATGAIGGAIVGGPVGAVVGGVAGAVVGGIAESMQPKFRTYVVERKHPNYVWKDQRVAPGVILPNDGVTYYEVPGDYGVREYRYTVVNGNTVLVDPRTRRIIQVIN